MELISIDEKQKWNEIICQFPSWDIYYLNEYAKSLQLHGDGIPYLLFHEIDGKKIAYVVMQQDIENESCFKGKIPRNTFLDWTTPYGYGGPLTEGNITADWMRDFMELLKQWCRQNKIVTQFFRFHPLLKNQIIMEMVGSIVLQKETVFVDTKDVETIWKNMTPNNRNMVRKAEKKGVHIFSDKGERLDEFLEIYEATMRMHHASEYYYFKKKYFTYLLENMKENIIFFYAGYEGKLISASMFFYNDEYMHYHLSGTLPEYRTFAAANLLLTKASEWAAENGIHKMHLGGGVEAEDNLFNFKKNFNRYGRIDFFIGRTIFDEGKYKELIQFRKKIDEEFDENKKYLILYRG